MADSNPKHQPETTFRNYSSKQARDYDTLRSSYPKELINYILLHHQNAGGQFGLVLDLGCGPGNSTRDFASHFDNAIGLDPSPQMIETAKKIGGQAKSSNIMYICGESEICPGIPDSSVDLITAGTSAHWFDMVRFWPTAARVLKPGGTVAIFVIVRRYIHPSFPNHKEAQKLFWAYDEESLKDHKVPGNKIVRENYDSLLMPWNVSEPVEAFPQARSVRKMWNKDGQPEEDGYYMGGVREMSFEQGVKAAGTGSAITRWRSAHPELANTDQDIMHVAFKKMRALIGEDVKALKVVGPTTLILFQNLDHSSS